jgi:hypothetical protein
MKAAEMKKTPARVEDLYGSSSRKAPSRSSGFHRAVPYCARR